MRKPWLIKEEKLFRKFLLLNRGFMAKLKIIQTKSVIDRPEKQKKIIEALGLGRPNWEKIHNDTPQIRGMINKVTHLVKVEEVKE
ncbi:MAG: rpmD [Ignavibacteriaceae bacterium]|jgi:large subunit ribosomal protein L30|nr:rpmD [Ignavibacteriaceae bacterium]